MTMSENDKTNKRPALKGGDAGVFYTATLLDRRCILPSEEPAKIHRQFALHVVQDFIF